MTRVCLVGDDDVDLRSELLASDTAREALSSYELTRPYANCIGVETISVGAAVSLLNDLDWYLRRYAADALVLEPSVSRTEWLSRALATAIRNERLAPGETGTFLKIYGVVPVDEGAANDGDAQDPRAPDDGGPDAAHALVEPLYARRIGGETPAYDLQEVLETVVVRVTAEEFGA